MTDRLFATLFFAVLLVGFAGCSRQDEEITAYEIPKESAVYEANHIGKKKLPAGHPEITLPKAKPAKPAQKQRMLAAMMLHGRKFWFFKIKGPDSSVNVVTKKFAMFIQTVDFKDAKPTWKLPKEWKQLPDVHPRNLGGIFPRQATILVDPDNKELELAVTSLLNRATDEEETKQFILLNVNRWRGQMGLKPRMSANLYDKATDADPDNTDEVRLMSINGHKTVLVQFVGFPQPRRPGRGPFMRR